MAASLSATGAFSTRVLGRSVARPRRTATTCRAVEQPKRGSIAAPAGWVAPEPKKFTVAEGSLGRVVSSAIPLVLRAGTGALISGWSPSLVDDDGEGYSILRVAGKKVAESSRLGPRPELTIEMFEYEGSPYCRKVREAAAVLDLDVLFRPCPSGETYWRPMAKAEGAKTFPYMKDPNTGTNICESDDIVEHLFRNYGPAASDAGLSKEGLRDAGPETLEIPQMLRRGGITNLTCYAAAVVRLKALKARPSRAAAAAKDGVPVEPLHLWTYEASPFTKAVRESLTELAVPHVVHYCPRGSAKRDELLERTGRFQVPYMEDPNTGIKMFESASMVEYLEQTYAL
jgi:glutathione S-transferase